MNTCTWYLGDCAAALTPAGVVVLDPGNEDIAPEFWTKLQEGVDFAGIVEILTSRFGSALTDMPGFAVLVHEDGGGRIAVRGDFIIELRSGEETIRLDGGALITWSERRVGPIDAWSILTPGRDAQEARATQVFHALDAVVPVELVEFGRLRPEREGAQEDSADEEADRARPSAEGPASDEERSGGEESGGGEAPAEAPGSAPEASTGSAEPHNAFAPDPDSIPRDSLPEMNLPSDTHLLTPEELAAESAEVLAVMCIEDHPNPPFAQSCRVCGQPMSHSLARVKRPPLGRLVLSTGETVLLDRDVILGRNPSAPNAIGRAAARLIEVEDPELEVSRNHCEIRVDGWDARLRDLGSQNGTFLVRPGQEDERVGEDSARLLSPGDAFRLGSGLTVRLEA